MKLGTLAFLLALLLSAGVWWGTGYYSTGEESLPPLHTASVDRGDVTQRVTAYGALQPVRKVTIGSQVSGIIDEIHVDFNSLVKRGQVLAQIDPSTFEAEVSSAEAELESAAATLELARHQWQRVQMLRERQFISPQEVDEANANLRQAEAQVSVRRHALDRAARELERCTITAPTDGIIISRNVDIGQTVAASLNAPELFEIAADLSRMQIHANVSEADIGRIREGQKVFFQVDGYRGRDFPGEVIQVRNAPLEMDNVVHYETIIAVENEEHLLKPGMTAEVAVITDESRNVIRVRNTALRARLPDNLIPQDAPEDPESNGQVYLFQNGELVAKRVQTGLSDGVNTEIVSGLQPGDTLAIGLSLQGGDQSGSSGLFGGNQAQF